MNIILIGCEYSGTSTLAVAINEWTESTMGVRLIPLHDHWKYPHVSGHPPDETVTSLTDDEMDQLLALTPKLKELFMRYTLYYHTLSYQVESRGNMLVGYHVDEAVYAPLYLGYGGPGQPGDRGAVARDIEQRILLYAPETVLVLLRASAEVIGQRMREAPHQHGLLQEKDIQPVLQMYEEHYQESQIRNKLVLDTSAATLEETLAEFVRRIEPYLTEADRLRMATRSL